MQASDQAKFFFSYLIITGRLAEYQLGNTSAFVANDRLFIYVALPGFTQHILVENFVRVLQPAQKC